MINMHQNCIQPGLCPGPRCSLRSSPDSPVGCPSWHLWPLDLGIFGALLLPPSTNSWLRYCMLCSPCQKILGMPLAV